MALHPHYQYLVQRKEPIRRLLGEAKKATTHYDKNKGYTGHMMDGKTVFIVQDQRKYINDRIKIAYWMIETITEKVPEFKKSSYMNSYNQVQTLVPLAIKHLEKAHTIKPEGVEDIKQAIRWLDIFMGEIT